MVNLLPVVNGVASPPLVQVSSLVYRMLINPPHRNRTIIIPLINIIILFLSFSVKGLELPLPSPLHLGYSIEVKSLILIGLQN